MKRYLLLTCLLVNIAAVSIGQVSNDRIVTFCKVWGFLKYYHPSVASGKLDWDSVFLNNIQKAIDSKTIAEFNKLLYAIVNHAGNARPIKPAKIPDSLFTSNQVNITWITHSAVLDNKIKNILKFIYENKNQGENKYIKIIYNTADFAGENKYENIGFPDIRYRLLFLARFWNIINYFAPYRYLIANWDNVLIKFIPKIVNSNDTPSYYKTLLELCKSLKDGHSELIVADQAGNDLVFGKYTMPFYYEIISGKVIIRRIENDPVGKNSNIEQGDIVLKVNNEDVQKLIKDRRKYISASNQVSENHLLGWFLLNGEAPSAKLTLQRAGKVFTTTVKRVMTSERNWGALTNYTYNDVGYKKINDSILLIYAAQIWNGNLDTLRHMITQSKAVIFDVRNYVQNDAFIYIADPFLSAPKIINYSTVALPDFPGLFKWKASPEIGHINSNAYKGKVAILVDERTQSQGEYSCMVLQTIPGAVTIGSQTAGHDGVKTYIPMGDKLSMSYSGYGIYYPDKSQTQQTGVKIDIPVKKTIGSVANNKDEILERALQYIKNSKISN